MRVYQGKVLAALAGKKEEDIYFSLIPPQQMLLKFSVSDAVPMQDFFIVERGKDYLRYMRGVSFWASQEFQLKALAICPEEDNEALMRPPIVVVDSFYEIRVYADVEIDKQSTLGRELRKRCTHRFPVPRCSVVQREKFELECPKQGDEYKTIELMLRQ